MKNDKVSPTLKYISQWEKREPVKVSEPKEYRDDVHTFVSEYKDDGVASVIYSTVVSPTLKYGSKNYEAPITVIDKRPKNDDDDMMGNYRADPDIDLDAIINCQPRRKR